MTNLEFKERMTNLLIKFNYKPMRLDCLEELLRLFIENIIKHVISYIYKYASS